VAAAAGTLLIVGLWTPIAASLSVSIELWLSTQVVDKLSHLHLAALALGLVMLGPGAFSIDARLFGRKRIDFRDPQ
jgi:putative oxidoreductase